MFIVKEKELAYTGNIFNEHFSTNAHLNISTNPICLSVYGLNLPQSSKIKFKYEISQKPFLCFKVLINKINQQCPVSRL